MNATNRLKWTLATGDMIDVAACETCPPGNPVMFIMMGNVMGHASESFGQAVADDFQAEFEDSFGHDSLKLVWSCRTKTMEAWRITTTVRTRRQGSEAAVR